jgi:hypothetical protein
VTHGNTPKTVGKMVEKWLKKVEKWLKNGQKRWENGLKTVGRWSETIENGCKMAITHIHT